MGESGWKMPQDHQEGIRFYSGENENHCKILSKEWHDLYQLLQSEEDIRSQQLTKVGGSGGSCKIIQVQKKVVRSGPALNGGF